MYFIKGISVEKLIVFIFQIVQESPFLTMDLLESCFPYALLRNSYHLVYKFSEWNLETWCKDSHQKH